MRFPTFALVAILALLPLRASAQDQPAAWKPLFDGKTLTGWHHFGEGKWVVEDGAIVGRTQEAARLYSLLVSDQVYHDCTIRLKFKSIKGNSGFYIRTVLGSPDQAHGLQIEVDPRRNAGGIYESYGRAWIARPDAETFARYFKPDDWNEMTIAAHGGNVKVTVNGTVAAEIKDDPSRPAGQLAMQMHAGNDMLVMFKDIEIQGEPKKTPDKKGPTTPKKIESNPDGSILLHARHCTITGSSLAYMPEWDALGFWRADESATWDVSVARPGTYDVVMEWSVDDKNAGNPFALEASQSPQTKVALAGNVQSTKRWDFYRREKIGQIQLSAGEHKIVFKANGDFKTALMDLRELRLTPQRARR